MQSFEDPTPKGSSGKTAFLSIDMRMAQEAEKEGFDSLWVFERLLWAHRHLLK